MPKALVRLTIGLLLSFWGSSLTPRLLAQTPFRPDPTTLVGALQQHYDQVRDFAADFIHVYEGGAMRMKATEKGTVLIKKPGKMRWHYNTPEDKLFVFDGQTIYAYFRDEAQVTVSPMPRGDEVGSAILLLTGRGDLVRDFRPEYVELPDLASDSYALRLEPIVPAPDYTSLILVVGRSNLMLHQLISTDRQGGTSTFQFSNLEENLGLADSHFSFTIPADVEVIRHDGVSQ